MTASKPVGVLFVCMGNICRSPMAEAIFRHLVGEADLDSRIMIDSAGTGGWHIGERPHRGTQAVLLKNGVDVGDQRARQVQTSDFSRFDYIVAMDNENMDDLAHFNPKARERVRLLLSYAADAAVREVPDPYYSGGFDHVYDLVTAGCRGLLDAIRREHGL